MKKAILIPFVLALFITAHSQKTEIHIGFSSGLFSFSGTSAASTSFLNYNNSTGTAYTNNPYGSKSGFCYGVSANVQQVSKKNFIAGFGLAYEVLKSKVSINGISGYAGSPVATGQTFLEYNFINTNPYLGYRFNSGKTFFDIVAGTDIAFCVKGSEKGNATAGDGKKITTAFDRKTITTDIRPRVQISATYKKAGIYLGYSLGLANYMKGYIGGTNEANGRMLRFGLTYQVN